MSLSLILASTTSFSKFLFSKLKALVTWENSKIKLVTSVEWLYFVNLVDIYKYIYKLSQKSKDHFEVWVSIYY